MWPWMGHGMKEVQGVLAQTGLISAHTGFGTGSSAGRRRCAVFSITPPTRLAQAARGAGDRTSLHGCRVAFVIVAEPLLQPQCRTVLHGPRHALGATPLLHPLVPADERQGRDWTPAEGSRARPIRRLGLARGRVGVKLGKGNELCPRIRVLWDLQ